MAKFFVNISLPSREALPIFAGKEQKMSEMAQEADVVHKISKDDLTRLVTEFQIEKIRNPNNQSQA